MKTRALPAAIALCVALSISLAPAVSAQTPPRPGTWATAVSGTAVGNLYSVEKDLFRSAQPTNDGFRQLAALGVKSVLSVSGEDTQAANGSGLKLFHVPMTAFGLRDAQVLEALRILTDPANRPIVIHCQHGADRTGAIMALYRVAVEGWSKEDAIREMNEGGFHHSSIWRNLDRYVLDADIEGLRRKLQIAAPAPGAGGVQAAASVVAATAAPALSPNP